MRRWLGMTVALVAVATLVGCGAGPNELAGAPDGAGHLAGFWLGLWHGFIVLFTLLVSLVVDNVHIYEVHNSGTLYDLGFVLGLIVFFGGGSSGACKGQRNLRH